MLELERAWMMEETVFVWAIVEAHKHKLAVHLEGKSHTGDRDLKFQFDDFSIFLPPSIDCYRFPAASIPQFLQVAI
jgi:hypothetical protein